MPSVIANDNEYQLFHFAWSISFNLHKKQLILTTGKPIQVIDM